MVLRMMSNFAALLQNVNDAQADVREGSYNALGTAMKVVSEKGIMPFLADVDAIKMAKVSYISQYQYNPSHSGAFSMLCIL